jgi:uncharacterized OsmC-like protein
MTTTQTDLTRLNGVNVPLMQQLMSDVKNNPGNANTKWGVSTRWITGTLSETLVEGCQIRGKNVSRTFRFRTDEPLELAGSNTVPNPQEYLMGALNACMVVGYVALSTHFGIELETLEIDCEGEIDLRGFLGLSKDVKPGYDEIRYTVHIKGNGTEEQFRQIHEMVKATSPNYFNISQPVKLVSNLIID